MSKETRNAFINIISFAMLILFVWLMFFNDSDTETATATTHTTNTAPPVNINFKILSDESTGSARKVEIQLEERTDTSKLAIIAKRVKATEQREYERTFIGYRLKDEGDSYWATTHYNPALEIKILGTTQRDHLLLQKKVVTQENVFGSWLVQRGIEHKLVAYRKNGSVFIKAIYSSGENEEQFEESSLKAGIKLQDESGKDHGEYYLINQNGDLEFWSENGNYYTAKKI
jgi:hypothetical protein